MTQEKMNKMTSKIMMMAVLMTGLLFIGTHEAVGQEVCKKWTQLTKEKGEAKVDHQLPVVDPGVNEKKNEARDCWVRKAKNDEKELRQAYLWGANLSEADLIWADLTGAHLIGAVLFGADLSDANLSGANLTWANLQQANLSDANLSGANLSGADLSNANLTDADLSGANLATVRLWGANLRGANLTKAALFGEWQSLRGAIVSRSTTIGVDFDKWAFRGGKVVD